MYPAILGRIRLLIFLPFFFYLDPQLWEAAVRYQEQVGGRVRFPLLYLKVDNESGKVVDVGKVLGR